MQITHGLYGHALGGNAADEGDWFEQLRERVGDDPVKDGVEMQDIMTSVAKYLGPDTWQFCTIEAWLNGTPSEDDLDWKAEYFSEMPRLEEFCGDHAKRGRPCATTS